jgi:hypothetical protein
MTLDLSSLRENPDLVARNPDLFAEPVTKPSKPRKYRNEPTEYGGRYYQSIKEATRAEELDLLKRAGEIIAWFPQVSFPLEKGIRYVADFVVLLPDLSVRVEDAKGVRTKEYRIKKKLFEARYPGWKITEV